MSYLAILLALLIFFAFIHKKNNLQIYSSKKQALITTSFFFVLGLIWDSYAVVNGHWFFDEDKLIGITIGVIPLEEYLFFLIVPYCILVAYTFLAVRFGAPRNLFGYLKELYMTIKKNILVKIP